VPHPRSPSPRPPMRQADAGPRFSSYLLRVFLFSTTLHEAAHAWAAKLGGDLTAYHGGRVTLDPRPHIRREPFGMVVLPLLSVVTSGWRERYG
jgi:hypothetical protein